MFYRIAFILVFLVSIVATPRETHSLVMIEHLQTHRLICWPCMAMYVPTLAWPSQNSCSSRCHCSGAVDGICTDVYSLQHDRKLETYRTQPISGKFMIKKKNNKTINNMERLTCKVLQHTGLVKTVAHREHAPLFCKPWLPWLMYWSSHILHCQVSAVAFDFTRLFFLGLVLYIFELWTLDSSYVSPNTLSWRYFFAKQ